MNKTEANFKIHSQLTDSFKIEQDLKQGGGLAPCLFNLILENVHRKLTINIKRTLGHQITQIIG